MKLRRWHWVLLSVVFLLDCQSASKADMGLITSGSMVIQEVDGSPSGSFSTVKFSNGAMTDNGDGTATITTGAGGGGDVFGPTASTNNELPLFSGTGGKTLQRSNTLSGLPKLTAGVLSIATPGTDYVVASGNVATATALAANGGNCTAGLAPLGVDASGVAEGCFDVGTQTELDAHINATTAHSATSANTASRLVLRDASGNFSAGIMTGTLAGNATTATGLATDGGNCPAGQFAQGIDASGAAQGCTALPTTIAGTANQIAASASTGAITLSIPTNPTLPGTTTGTFSGSLTGNASTATALAANGANCPAGQYPLGVDASGAAEGCTVAGGGGAPTDSAYWTATAIAGLSAEVNLGALTTGLLKHTVSAGVSTPATAVAETDYVTPTGVGRLTNKQLTRKLLDAVDAPTIGVDVAVYNRVRVDELSSATTTFSIPTLSTGTREDGDFLEYSIFCTVQRTLVFQSGTNGFSATHGMALPTVCRAGGRLSVGFVWHADTAKWELVACTACGGTGFVHLPVGAVRLPTSNPAALDGSEALIRLRFDDTISECGYWVFRMPPDYAASPVLKWQYSMFSATSGGISLNISLTAVTPGDAEDVQTATPGTVNNCDDTTVPGTAGRLKEVSCPLTNTDALAAGDLTRLEVCRLPSDSADTATGDLEGLAAMLEYAK